MQDGSKNAAMIILGGVGAAAISAFVSYQVANIQAEATVRASNQYLPLEVVPLAGGALIVNSNAKALVFCALKPGEPSGEDVKDRSVVSCSQLEIFFR